jgi:hypothetical protein
MTSMDTPDTDEVRALPSRREREKAEKQPKSAVLNSLQAQKEMRLLLCNGLESSTGVLYASSSFQEAISPAERPKAT